MGCECWGLGFSGSFGPGDFFEASLDFVYFWSGGDLYVFVYGLAVSFVLRLWTDRAFASYR